MAAQCHFFAGCDPAQADSKRADDGAFSIGVAVDRREHGDRDMLPQPRDYDFGYVYHRVIRGFSSVQWAAYIHMMHSRFGFSHIMLDAGSGGGGINVSRHLKERDQEFPTDIIRDTGRRLDIVRSTIGRQVRPILDRYDLSAVDGDTILCLAKRGDPAVDALWNDGKRNWSGDECFQAALIEEMQTGLKSGLVGFLPPFEEWDRDAYQGWDQEQIQSLRLSGALQAQLLEFGVQTVRDAEGVDRWVTNSRGVKRFILPPRKDIAFSGMYAWGAFLTWLKLYELGWVNDSNGSEVWVA